jgi:hypothetical protein
MEKMFAGGYDHDNTLNKFNIANRALFGGLSTNHSLKIFKKTKRCFE